MGSEAERAGDFGDEKEAVSKIERSNESQCKQNKSDQRREEKNIQKNIEVEENTQSGVWDAEDFGAGGLKNGQAAFFIELTYFGDPENIRRKPLIKHAGEINRNPKPRPSQYD